MGIHTPSWISRLELTKNFQLNLLENIGQYLLVYWKFCSSTTSSLMEIQKMTRLRVVDNSAIGRAAELAGKPPKVIHVYTKTGIGMLGDKVLVAIQGQKKARIFSWFETKTETDGSPIRHQQPRAGWRQWGSNWNKDSSSDSILSAWNERGFHKNSCMCHQICLNDR